MVILTFIITKILHFMSGEPEQVLTYTSQQVLATTCGDPLNNRHVWSVLLYSIPVQAVLLEHIVWQSRAVPELTYSPARPGLLLEFLIIIIWQTNSMWETGNNQKGVKCYCRGVFFNSSFRSICSTIHFYNTIWQKDQHTEN